MINPINFYPSPRGVKNYHCINRSSITLLDHPRDCLAMKLQTRRIRPNAMPPTSSLSSSAPSFALHHNAYDKVIHTVRNGLLCILLLSSSCSDADARQLLLERPSTNIIATPTVEEEVSTLFDTWNDALMTKDPDIIANLYDEQDGVLVPTLSNQIRYNKKGIKDYFTAFMSRDPVGRVVESQTVVEGNVAVRSGIYMFTLGSEGGKELPARFTFVYHRVARNGGRSSSGSEGGGEWRIIAHHSSLLPETVVSSK